MALMRTFFHGKLLKYKIYKPACKRKGIKKIIFKKMIFKKMKFIKKKFKRKYCCEVMKEKVNYKCSIHNDPFECPDNLVSMTLLPDLQKSV